MMERLEKERVEIFKEGMQYAAELAFFIWVMLSISLCSGMFVENPVQEKFLKIRYMLNVVGLKQQVYWVGNLIFDLLVFLIQGILMILMVFPFNLEAYCSEPILYFSLVFSFGFAHVTFSYFISFWFSTS